jgi:hypothetical protein
VRSTLSAVVLTVAISASLCARHTSSAGEYPPPGRLVDIGGRKLHLNCTGWSDPGPAEETVEETVRDLHALLQASSERGPYVLVGASIGGIFIQAYQRAYPKDVAALAFTNSSNRVGF